MFNVLLGARYKVVCKEVKDYVHGLYGRFPAPIAPELRTLVGEPGKTIDTRPADQLAPEMERARAAAAAFGGTEEEALSLALFPDVAANFFKRRAAAATPA